MVTVVSVVVVDGSGGASSAALSVGIGGVSLLGLSSVVDTDGVGVGVVYGVGLVFGVSRTVGATGTGACRDELCAVCSTASTKITSSSTAATPET